MPSHKSAEKRVRQNKKRQARNKQWKSRVRNSIRIVRDAIASGDGATALAQLPATVAMIDKAKSKGVLPKNRASRVISRLTLAVNKAQA